MGTEPLTTKAPTEPTITKAPTEPSTTKAPTETTTTKAPTEPTTTKAPTEPTTTKAPTEPITTKASGITIFRWIFGSIVVIVALISLFFVARKIRKNHGCGGWNSYNRLRNEGRLVMSDLNNSSQSLV